MGNRKRVKISLCQFRDRFILAYIISMAAVLFFAAITFMYIDIVNTIDNSNILLRAIYHRRVLDFYELSVEQSVTNFAANYNFIIYVAFAIWQTPVFLVAHLLNRDYLTWPWAMLWSKLLVVFFSILAVFMVYQIVLLCTENKKRSMLAVIFCYSSMFVFYPIFVSCQIDVFSTTFMLIGVYYYLKDDWKRFWLAFFIAVPFKMFALLLALPLILAKQKNLLRTLCIWISMAGLIAVENIVFRDSPIHKYALKSQSRDAIDNLLGANITLGWQIVVFVACYMALALYAYMKKDMDKATAIYMGFFLWGTFITFSAINTYWVFLEAPFMVMSMCINDKYLKYTSLAELIASIGYFLTVADGNAIFRDSELVTRLFLPRVMTIPGSGELKYGTLYGVFTQNQWDRYKPLFTTVFISAIIAILALTLPWLQQKDGEKEEPEKWLLCARLVFLVVVCVVTVYGYTARTNPVAIDTREIENVASAVDLAYPGNKDVVSQKIVFDEDRKLDELVLKFNNTLYARQNMGLLYVELWDKGSGDKVFDDVIGCSFIPDNGDLSVDLKHTAVEKYKTYEIRLYGKAGNIWYQSSAHLYPYFTTESGLGLSSVEINGERQQNYLYFGIR